jgi:hypothetical protein
MVFPEEFNAAFVNIGDAIKDALVSAWNAITYFFKDIPVAAPASPCPLMNKSMTTEQAQKYMDDFKKTDIPFDYPVDCCYARARKMCDDIEADGYDCKKFWFSGAGTPLEPVDEHGAPVTFPSVGRITWNYHVAPQVPVIQPDGNTQQMILDPSLSDKPLTVDQWKSRCGPTGPQSLGYTSDSDGDIPFNGNYDAIVAKDKMGKMSVSDAEQVLEEHKDNRDLALP